MWIHGEEQRCWWVGVSFISAAAAAAAAAAARGLAGLDTEQQPTITLRPAMQLSHQSTNSQTSLIPFFNLFSTYFD